MDIRDLNRRTLATTIEIVDAVRGDQLDLPTPCAEWTLRQLLGHMIGQHYGFAAAARGETSDLSVWADRPPGTDLHAAYLPVRGLGGVRVLGLRPASWIH